VQAWLGIALVLASWLAPGLAWTHAALPRAGWLEKVALGFALGLALTALATYALLQLTPARLSTALSVGSSLALALAGWAFGRWRRARGPASP